MIGIISAVIIMEIICHIRARIINIFTLYMKRSTYYYNVKKPVALDKYAEVKASILEIYEKSNKTYGYPRITKVLEKLGYTYDKKTVAKLMNELNISSLIRVKKRYK